MPPNDQSGSGMAMLAALSGKMGGVFGGLAGDALGLKSSGALFVGILVSRTVQDDMVGKFGLRKVYWESSWEGARRDLSANTGISEDPKSGIITITVTDHESQARRRHGPGICHATQFRGQPAQHFVRPPRAHFPGTAAYPGERGFGGRRKRLQPVRQQERHHRYRGPGQSHGRRGGEPARPAHRRRVRA